ncbi:kelch-like protein 3 [Paramacrobiotus metropolitanus]|uniref:kelch-like protein 3 n=1 Tax=Paramacrobiotus metropolitanus TaxID=2943436 RepID=UPI002445BAB9|nr:kelch-like protein 3 [Paramacrobiotus metropolitanus]
MSKRKRSDNDRSVNDYLPVALLRELRELQSTGTFCDVVLKGSEESAAGIPCHRNLLSAHSAYFRAAFTENWKDSKQPAFQLHNIDSRTLNELVKYFYTMEISVNDDNVEAILTAAQFLQLDSLAKRCWRYVEEHMRLSDSLVVHALASQHYNPVLAETALGYIRRRFPQFAHSQDFLQMDAQQLNELIASDEVDVESEDQVWQAVLCWLDHDRGGRAAHAKAVLQGVRAAFLSDQCRQEYTVTVASAAAAVPSCQSAMVSEVTDGRTEKPRHSYGAHEVILCVGGRRCDGTVDVFSPSIPAVWRLQPPGPRIVDPCGVMVRDGSSLLIARSYDVVTMQRDSRYVGLEGQWGRRAEAQISRLAAGLAALNGRMYAAGGYGAGDSPLASVEMYDPGSDAWSAVAALPVGLARLALVACGGRLYAFGGERNNARDASNWALAYDPAANAWSRLADMPTARSRCVACVGPGGLIYVIGGYRWTGLAQQMIGNRGMGRRVEAYDPVSNQWLRKGDLVMPRSEPASVSLDGKLYVLGGSDDENGNGCLDSIEVYDEEADRWELHECRLPQARSAFGCAVMKLRRG